MDHLMIHHWFISEPYSYNKPHFEHHFWTMDYLVSPSIHLQNHHFEVTSSPDLFFPHLQATMHGSLCFSSWGGLLTLFFRGPRWGEWCEIPKRYMYLVTPNNHLSQFGKKTLFYDCMIYFSVVFFLSKRPVFHRGFCLVRSRVDVDFRHQRNTNLEAQSHPRLIRIAIHLRFRFLRFKEFLYSWLTKLCCSSPLILRLG